MIEVIEETIEYDYFDDEAENGDIIKLCDVLFTVTAEQANKMRAISSGECELIKVVREVK